MYTGKLIAKKLAERGIAYVFGVPGGQTLPYYRGINETPGIEHVLMHDERSGGFAADGYARVTGRTAVCDATVGPGATNLPSAVAEAYSASIPMLAIVSDLERKWEARRERGNMSQGMRQGEMFETFTKWHATISVAEATDEIVETALRIANTGRPGPVALLVPEDVFRDTIAPAPAERPAPADRPAKLPWYRAAPDPEAVAGAARTVLGAHRPALLVGGGIHLSGAYAALAELVDCLQCPVATTITGKGAIPEDHPLALGVAGSMGRSVANDILATSDCLIMVGTKAGQVATYGWELPAPEASVIHMDVDPEEIGRTYPNATAVLGDARLCLEALAAAVQARAPSRSGAAATWDRAELAQRLGAWHRRLVTDVPDPAGMIRPQRVMDMLSRSLGPHDVVVTDASLSSGWGASYTTLTSTGRRFLAPRGMGGLGWGLPAAIGAALGLREFPERNARVYLIAGDGGFSYSVQELEVVARLGLPITVLLLNNNCLAWIKQTQRVRGLSEVETTAFMPVEYSRVSAAFNVPGFRTVNAAEFADVLGAAQASSGPSLIEIPCDAVETPVIRLAESAGGAAGGAAATGEGL